MFCKKCGSFIEDDARFCPKCGADQKEGQESDISLPTISAQPKYEGRVDVKKFSFIAVLLLGILTCGIYHLYFLYRTTEDYNQLTALQQRSGQLEYEASFIEVEVKKKAESLGLDFQKLQTEDDYLLDLQKEQDISKQAVSATSQQVQNNIAKSDDLEYNVY